MTGRNTMYVYVWERERERERERVCVSEREILCAFVCEQEKVRGSVSVLGEAKTLKENILYGKE